MLLIGVAAPFDVRALDDGETLSPLAFCDVTSTTVVFGDHSGPSIGVASVRCAADALAFRLAIDACRPAAALAFEAVCRGEIAQCSIEHVPHEAYGRRIIRSTLRHIALCRQGAYPGTVAYAVRDDGDLYDLPPPAWPLARLWWPGMAA